MRGAVTAGRTLPGRYYTSNEIFAAEAERIFARRWTYVCRETALGKAGDFVVVNAGGESLILTRAEDGRVRAFFNVCRHRGTQLCERPSGHFAGAIVCPYHAWTYGLDGTLRAARNMQDAEGFDRADYPLQEAAVECVAGFVFVKAAVQGGTSAEVASSESESACEFLQPLAEKFEQWNIARLVSVRALTYDVACNWKLPVQNYSECYHCPVIHPQLDKLSPWDSGSNDLIDGAVIGGPMWLREFAETMSVSGHAARRPLGSVSGEDLRRVYYYALFPTMLLSLHPDYVMVHRIEPLAVDRSRVTCEWLFDPEAAATPGFDASDAIDFWDVTNRQDWHVCELSQRGVSSRAYSPGPYSPHESMLRSFDAYYLGALGAV